MGSAPKARRPAPAPPPIPPASPESEDTKLASEANILEQRRKKGRTSTLIAPSNTKSLVNTNMNDMKNTLG